MTARNASCCKLSDIHPHHLVDNGPSANLVVVSSNEYLKPWNNQSGLTKDRGFN